MSRKFPWLKCLNYPVNGVQPSQIATEFALPLQHGQGPDFLTQNEMRS